ncbi:hypothetical protein L198_07053 [Cryptococcus wingfieldii CBS 7118]|uniref:Uncharacterized protein n=1 Tax=Cryptococcus wingfieldii CBS 7118 TaxID=1295528 RepID=A0A1E3IFQ6_9TREE|nr:hypothetical protein L198_07053 [Cryptococcus wingfieldii CBS 7118]ODN87427.1 hypothetical protein L198_07053 [Cryptococcus wingfieldii CBS 7118]
MAAACVASPSKHSHPAHYTYLSPVDLAPTTFASTPNLPARRTSKTAQDLPNPTPSYAALRSMHAYALKYVMARLRWDQSNNMYLPGQDGVWNHDQVIHELEDELKNVEDAQETLDQWPEVFAPVWFPEPHGPKTKEQDAEIKKLEERKEAIIDAKLHEAFPWIKQIFIGPKTKKQAANDKLLREQMRNGFFDNMTFLLPSENKRMALEHNQKKAAAPRKNYEQRRMEKERAKVAAYLEAHPQAPRQVAGTATSTPAPTSAKPIGPLTKDQALAALPKQGPASKDQVLHEVQRRQRQMILGWLHKPWNKYDEEASGLIEKLALMARDRLGEQKKAAERDGEKAGERASDEKAAETKKEAAEEVNKEVKVEAK